MQSINILREIEIKRTPRVMQLEGIFDVPPSQRSAEEWTVNLDLPDDWNVGLIVGPSGSGKTTVARELFGDYLVKDWPWPDDKSIVDGFPTEMSIKDITGLLSSVGFSSPPSWVRPFRVLSNGEQFRVNMARTLAEMKELAVVDEFTSVVDRTVAQIGSAAIAKTVRKRQQRFIAVSCHYDIADWLEPDWVYQPHTNELYTGRYLYQRPKIELEIKRVHYSAWQLFKKHHYLSSNLNSNTNCFVALWQGIPIAFQAWCHFPHATRRPTKRISRTVVLPDYQGVGVGQSLTNLIASVVKGMGYSAITTTAHPGRISGLAKSITWIMTKRTAMNATGSVHSRSVKGIKSSFGRLTAAFEYIGPALPTDEARRLWTGA
jgi:ABC-type phosphate/phosphonate transport system ATPase subunit